MGFGISTYISEHLRIGFIYDVGRLSIWQKFAPKDEIGKTKWKQFCDEKVSFLIGDSRKSIAAGLKTYVDIIITENKGAGFYIRPYISIMFGFSHPLEGENANNYIEDYYPHSNFGITLCFNTFWE